MMCHTSAGSARSQREQSRNTKHVFFLRAAKKAVACIERWFLDMLRCVRCVCEDARTAESACRPMLFFFWLLFLVKC